MQNFNTNQLNKHVFATKHNNYISKGKNIKKYIKCVIIFEAVLGIRRLYLYDYRKCTRYISVAYTILLTLFTAGSLCISIFFNMAHVVDKDMLCIQSILLNFGALFLQKKKLNDFFKKLQHFDEMINIDSDLSIIAPVRWYFYGICISIVYNIFESLISFTLILLHSNTNIFKNSLHVICSPITVRDSEMLFFCFLLIMVSRRLSIVKAHVIKAFTKKDKILKNKQNKLEALSEKANLDISALYNIYDSLHKSSEVLNSVMSYPIMVLLTTSAVSTIILFKNFLTFFGYSSKLPFTLDISTFYQVAIIYVLANCLKYTSLMIFPCYLSNVTKSQVESIRSILFDALNNNALDVIERRKLKAFYLLTCERNFSYSLWIFKMDMSLPLCFCNFCTTYLIIALQFSKCID